MTARSGWFSAVSVGIRSIAPKRRASLKVTRAPALHIQHDMVMFGGGGVGVVEIPDLRAGNQHPPRHAQMNEQGFPARQVGQDILGPPPQPQNLGTGQPFGHAFGGKGQRRSGRFTAAFSIRRPSITGKSPMRTVSTSGQFGHATSWRH